MHAGVTEDELVKRLRDYFDEAEKLKNGKKLWILMDEFNTSPL